MNQVARTEMNQNEYKVRYTDERNAQIVIALLKAHQVKKIVVSPGMTNVCLVASLQNDSFFELYSAPDERSAAYMACGLSVESSEIVVLSCTGATASRNYYPGLTEAYYSKIPLLVITSSRRSDRIGHNFDQVTDRTMTARDVAKISVQVPYVRDKEDEWACEIAVNRAILETKRHGCGPVHINLETMYSPIMNYGLLPPARVIRRFFVEDDFPIIESKRVAIIVGAHAKWENSLTEAVELFCEQYNGAVFCDHTSNYRGKYRVFPNILAIQKNNQFDYKNVDLLISIGNISSSEYGICAKESWRVNVDGEIRDTFWNLTNVFEMNEDRFFSSYVSEGKSNIINTEFFSECNIEELRMIERINDIPFSNVWTAWNTIDKIPADSVVHLGIRNSLRSWNYFQCKKDVTFYSNTGGFGIDGSLSSVLGNSLATNRLCFCVLGDLAFFYDMNVLGNRHINAKLRILMINNGTGMEMQFTDVLADKVSDDTNAYIAAAGHYGNKSKSLVRDIANDLGFMYLSASDKNEYINCIEIFCSEQEMEQPIILEVFVEKKDEDDASTIISELNGKQPEKMMNKGIKLSTRLEKQKNCEYVVFGTGTYFKSHISKICQIQCINYACDNNPDKWGMEVAPGIKCISPNELTELSNPFVLISVADATSSLLIANQLIDMGIDKFEHIVNWINYEEGC